MGVLPEKQARRTTDIYKKIIALQLIGIQRKAYQCARYFQLLQQPANHHNDSKLITHVWEIFVHIHQLYL